MDKTAIIGGLCDANSYLLLSDAPDDMVDFARTACMSAIDWMHAADERYARVTAERDKAIAEIGKIGRELGKCQAEQDRLRELLAWAIGDLTLAVAGKPIRNLDELVVQAHAALNAEGEG